MIFIIKMLLDLFQLIKQNRWDWNRTPSYSITLIRVQCLTNSATLTLRQFE